MNSTERQKDMTPEDEPPRSEDVQYAAREEWRAITNSSRKNEAVGPKWKWHSLVDIPGGESKIQGCKEQYCNRNLEYWVHNQGKLDMVKQDMARVNIDILVSGECNLLSSVSSQQRFEVMDVKALGTSQLSDSPCYSSWTDQFYLENTGKYILETWGHADPKDTKRRESPGPLAPLFICFFLPAGPALCKLG